MTQADLDWERSAARHVPAVQKAKGCSMDPVVFLHNPKAGGTSITDALRRCYAPNDVAPTLESAPQDRWPSAWRRLSRFKFVAGHFGHEVAAQHFPHHALITNFRHPVKRIVSLYDFWRSLSTSAVPRVTSWSGPAVARRLTFAEFVRSNNSFLQLYITNFHTRQLLDSGWVPRAIDTGDMMLAKERTTGMRWFYVCEMEHESVAWLRDAFPSVVAGGGIHRTNVNGAGTRTAPSAADLAVIHERNSYDIELYDFAVSLMQARAQPTACQAA